MLLLYSDGMSHNVVVKKATKSAAFIFTVHCLKILDNVKTVNIKPIFP